MVLRSMVGIISSDFEQRRLATSVFEDIPWGTQMVFQETLMKLKQTSHTVGLLPVWSDIDTIDGCEKPHPSSRKYII